MRTHVLLYPKTIQLQTPICVSEQKKRKIFLGGEDKVSDVFEMETM